MYVGRVILKETCFCKNHFSQRAFVYLLRNVFFENLQLFVQTFQAFQAVKMSLYTECETIECRHSLQSIWYVTLCWHDRLHAKTVATSLGQVQNLK